MKSDSIQSITVFRGEFEPFDGEAECRRGLDEHLVCDGGLKDRFARRTVVSLEHGDHIFRNTDRRTLAAFFNNVQDIGVVIDILPSELENLRSPQSGAERQQSHIMELRIDDFQFAKQGFGFPLGQKAQPGVVDFDHLPDAALGGQRISAAPHAGGDGPVDGRSHEVKNVVDGRPGKEFARFALGILFCDCVACRGFQQLRLEDGEQARRDIDNRRRVDFVPQMSGVLAIMLVNVLAFAVPPGTVGFNGLSDGHFVAFDRIDAGIGKFREEFGSGVSGALRTDAVAVPADSFPVAFALVIGEPEAVHLVGFSGAGIALGGHTVEDAFKLSFDVFPGCCVVHGEIVQARPDEGNEIIQNLSKVKNTEEKIYDNYMSLIVLLFFILSKWDGERERERERAAGQVKERASDARAARLKAPDAACRQMLREEKGCHIAMLMNVSIFL